MNASPPPADPVGGAVTSSATSQPVSATAFRIEPADLERDRATILQLWERHLPGGIPLPDRRYTWEFLDNPAGRAHVFLLVSDQTGAAVGTTALIPRIMQTANGTGLAGRASLMVVDKAFRLLGPAVMLQRRVLDTAAREEMLAVFSVVPAKALPVFKRLGFREGGLYTRFATPVSLRKHVERVAGPRLGAALGVPVDLAWRLISRDTWTRLSHCRTEVTRVFDGRFDDLWARAAIGWGTTTVRSSVFLTWRFVRCPWAESFTTITVAAPDGRGLSGYAVGFVRGGHANVYDAFWDRARLDPAVLLSAIVRWARAAGASTVSCLAAGSDLAAALESAGLRPRDDGDERSTLVIAPQRGSTTTPAPADPWSILAADNF